MEAFITSEKDVVRKEVNTICTLNAQMLAAHGDERSALRKQWESALRLKDVEFAKSVARWCTARELLEMYRVRKCATL